MKDADFDQADINGLHRAWMIISFCIKFILSLFYKGWDLLLTAFADCAAHELTHQSKGDPMTDGLAGTIRDSQGNIIHLGKYHPPGCP